MGKTEVFRNNMADLKSLLSLFSFILVYYGECSEQFLEGCRGLGFADGLFCSSCKDLDKFNLQKLKDDCNSCCKDDSTPEVEAELFHYAELAVCN